MPSHGQLVIGPLANKYTVNKACDFCYSRKMKCSGQKPRCSHCITYSTECTFGAPSRQSRPKSRKAPAKSEESNASLQTRVQHLEAQFVRLAERARAAEQRNETQTRLQDPMPIPSVTLSAEATSGGSMTGHRNPSPRSMELPPLHQAMPLIHAFLEKFNAVLPLFHPGTLLRLVRETYHLDPQRRDPVAWAAINTVLALTYRQGLAGSSNIKHAVEYLNRAQSVLSDVVLGETQLLNVQVLVGMVIVILSTLDLQPALILIATTMRLAHRLGLHDRVSSLHLDPALARQRACVFWLAYILDKDLSFSSKQPSIQFDDDIDLDLPWPQDDESRLDASVVIDDREFGTGVIASSDGTVEMNYFISRIQLAVIEGGVYDYLYSTRSHKRTPEERSRALESVARGLQQWKASIPPEFSSVGILNTAPPDMLQFFCVLYGTTLMCTASVNQANAWNAQWMTSLRRHGMDGTVPPLPPQWQALVNDARDLLVLYRQLGDIDRWNFCTVIGCSYMTAMVLLTANSMRNPLHDQFSLDEDLVDVGIKMLGTIVEETKSDELGSFRDACVELNQRVQKRRGDAIMMANEALRTSFSIA